MRVERPFGSALGTFVACSSVQLICALLAGEMATAKFKSSIATPHIGKRLEANGACLALCVWNFAPAVAQLRLFAACVHVVGVLPVPDRNVSESMLAADKISFLEIASRAKAEQVRIYALVALEARLFSRSVCVTKEMPTSQRCSK